MSTALLCLLGFVGWTLLLLISIGVIRVSHVLTGARRPNEFPGGERHGSDRYWRLNRAHANCLENLPIFAALVLVAAAADVSEPRLGQLAVVILAGRVGQSVAHISSGRNLAVNVRFAFFLSQLVCFVWMGILIARTRL
ncbi:MAG: MAPEG family protein [Myxococcota bacterium]